MFFAAVFVWFMILLYHRWNGFTQCISGFTTMHCIKRLFTYLLTGWCSIGAVHLFVCLSVCLCVCHLKGCSCWGCAVWPLHGCHNQCPICFLSPMKKYPPWNSCWWQWLHHWCSMLPPRGQLSSMKTSRQPLWNVWLRQGLLVHKHATLVCCVINFTLVTDLDENFEVN